MWRSARRMYKSSAAVDESKMMMAISVCMSYGLASTKGFGVIRHSEKQPRRPSILTTGILPRRSHASDRVRTVKAWSLSSRNVTICPTGWLAFHSRTRWLGDWRMDYDLRLRPFFSSAISSSCAQNRPAISAAAPALINRSAWLRKTSPIARRKRALGARVPASTRLTKALSILPARAISALKQRVRLINWLTTGGSVLFMLCFIASVHVN